MADAADREVPRVTSVESVQEALREKGACILEGCDTTREAGLGDLDGEQVVDSQPVLGGKFTYVFGWENKGSI